MRIESVVWHDRIDRSRYEVRSDQVTIDGERMSPKDEGWVCHAGRLLIIDQANKNRQFLEANREAQARITELEAENARLRDALKRCGNLTRYQECSPLTVREIGERVQKIVAKATKTKDVKE